MAINDTETDLKSIPTKYPTACSRPFLEALPEPFLIDLGTYLTKGAVGRCLAFLALHNRMNIAGILNEADAADAIIDALTDHCDHMPQVELDEQMAREICRILSVRHDVNILCGHVRILTESRNCEHKIKINKFMKRIVSQLGS